MNCLTPIKHLNTAISILKKRDSSQYKHVALELRLCIETITYKKLDFYSKFIPPSIKNTWQPGKFFRALIRLEPQSNKKFSLSIGREKIPGVAVKPNIFIGEHKTFDFNWLRKNYQKLSSILHVRGIKDSFNVKTYLEEVIEILEPIVNSSLDANFAQRIYLPCAHCGSKIPINLEVINEIEEYECLKEQCGCINFLIKEKEKLKLKENGFEFKCKCKKMIYLACGKLKIGDRFKCKYCHQCFRIKAFKASAVDDLS